MNRSNQSTTEGNYLRIVVGLNKRSANNHLLHVIFSDGTESKDKERVIYVLCRSVNGAKILKDKIEGGAIFSKGKDSLKIGFDVNEGVVKIIDPYTLKNLGSSAEFSISSKDVGTVGEGEEITIVAMFINPPQWVPIKNDNCLRMQGKGSVLEIRVVDRRLGEIVYRSDSIEITGSDLRVYGDQVKFDNGNVIKIGTKPKWKGIGPIFLHAVKVGCEKVCIFFAGEKDDDVESGNVTAATPDEAKKATETSLEPETPSKEGAAKDADVPSDSEAKPLGPAATAAGGDSETEPDATAKSPDEAKKGTDVPLDSESKQSDPAATAAGGEAETEPNAATKSYDEAKRGADVPSDSESKQSDPAATAAGGDAETEPNAAAKSYDEVKKGADVPSDSESKQSDPAATAEGGNSEQSANVAATPAKGVKKGAKPLPPPEIPSQLEVKGNGIGIKDVRTSDVERVIIRSRKRIRASVESTQQDNEKKTKTISIGDWIVWLVILLVMEVLVVLALTALPFWKFIPIRDKYLEVLQGGYATNEVVVANSVYTPSIVTNTLSIQTSCSNVMSQSAPTNCIDTIATSISSASGSPSLEGGKRQGVLGITLYFVLSCLLYVVFYVMFVCFTFLTLRALRRKRKLTADMSGVLEALRNERDKDKRKAMQRKILDDMINTYLDKPSVED